MSCSLADEEIYGQPVPIVFLPLKFANNNIFYIYYMEYDAFSFHFFDLDSY